MYKVYSYVLLLYVLLHVLYAYVLLFLKGASCPYRGASYFYEGASYL